ncbi:MAG: DUF2169 domain-containing protein [Minicystis sp.]
MKTIKPQKLGVAHRAFETAGRVDLCVTVMVASPFDAPERLLPEADLWKMLGEVLGKDTPPDAGMPKPRAEVLMIGAAHPPGGPRPACPVRLRMGRLDKTLQVTGDRTWDANGAASEPVPFTAMALTWSNAFGGPGHPANPAGKGFVPEKDESDGEGKEPKRGEARPLPNVEDPARLVKSPDDRSDPAGFGPHDVTWPERLSKAGTYDDAWKKDQAPGLPLDFDFAFYNTAPLDQQRDEPFDDGEAFAIENMHPDQPVLEGRLPRLRARIFVDLRGGELREVPMRLETVQLFPGARHMLVLFRGVTRVSEDDASDVHTLVAACEAIDAPRPLEHYRAVLAERLDKKRGALASLRDGDLMPEGSADERDDDPDAEPPEHLLNRNMRRKAARELEAARARIEAAGLDPDEHLPAALPPEEPAPSPDELPGMLARMQQEAEEQQRERARKRAEAEAAARQACSAAGIDHDKSAAPRGGPPKFSATAEIDKLNDQLVLARNAGTRLPAVEAQLEDPELRKKLQATEDHQRDAYRKQAHHLPPAPPAEASLTEEARVELPAGARAGVSFAGRDFTGVDSSGLDLRGIDLRSAFLEGALLAEANLAGADLTGAVLARADLTGADLTGAKLAGCNLGRALLSDAKVTGGVDLTGAVLTGADLSGATFRGARLSRVDLGEAVFHDTDFGEVVAENLTFLESDLRGAKLAGASLVKCVFIEVDLRGVDLTGADLTSATFVKADAGGAVLSGARLAKLCVVEESSFEGADFTGAVLVQANLRGTKLAGCNFTSAQLDAADLSGCDLQGARFDRAVGRSARFTRADLSRATLVDANLMSAFLDRTKLHGTSFLGAHLFRADLTKIDVDDATVMTEAILTQARIREARRPRATG